MRETGYYWVRIDNNWEIAFFFEKSWFVTCVKDMQNDEYFDEIDEKQIKRE